MAGTRSRSGLMCSVGSDLDCRIPRAKVPASALPPELRRKLGFDKLRPLKIRQKHAGAAPYNAGSNVLQPRESANGEYKAGCQKNFLRRGSGHSVSARLQFSRAGKTSFSAPTRASAIADKGQATEGGSRTDDIHAAAAQQRRRRRKSSISGKERRSWQ